MSGKELLENRHVTVAQVPAHAFRWKDRSNKHWVPQDMRTTHLFYVLKMIWNHSMPEDAKIHPYQPYSFTNFYTREYLKEAIIHLFNELITRKNLPGHLVQELHHMKRYLDKKRSKRLVKSK